MTDDEFFNLPNEDKPKKMKRKVLTEEQRQQRLENLKKGRETMLANRKKKLLEKSQEDKPVENKPVENKPVEDKPVVEDKPQDKPVENKPQDKPQEEENIFLKKALQTEPELKLNKNIEPKKRTRKPPAELPSEEELVGRDMLKELMKVINKYKTIELSDVLIEDNNGDYKHWEIYETLEKQINEPAEIETIDNKPKRKRNPPKPKIKEVVDINKHVQVLTPEKIEKQEKHNKIIKTQPIPYKSTDRTTVAKKGKLSSKDVFSLMMNTF